MPRQSNRNKETISRNGHGEPAQVELELEDSRYGRIRRVDINEQMKDAYLSYSMSVIVSRALPDARDGLKPVQRRILYVMHDTGLRADAPYRKSARIVGDVLGKYHPHGDMAVYDAMARMAQDFSLRYLLVDGQGNFGSVDGDPPAAMRYTEARLSKPSMDMLADLEKDTVEFQDNFDGTLQEPTVLPAALPNLLVNGATGIAVGMATNIPPHNLSEVCDATAYLIENWKRMEDVDVDELMKFMKGPDFPTGGIAFRYNDKVEGSDAIKAMYATGRSKITVQAKAHIEEGQRGKTHIIVTELPYEVNKSALIERIADLARDEKIIGITDIRDESDRRGMRIVIDIGKNDDPRAVLVGLYKYTAMKGTFGVTMLALVDGEPRVLPLKKLLQVFIEHRREIVRRRSEFELARARERAHILEGLVKALDIIDQIVRLIRRSHDTDVARLGLVKQLKFTELQANAILEMPLRRLAALERKKLEDELTEKRKQIKYFEDLLAHPAKMLGVIRDELASLKERFGDARRTTIIGDARHKVMSTDDVLTTHELVPTETVYVVVGQNGRIGRIADAPKITAQVGVVPAAVVKTTTADLVYVVGASGKAIVLSVANLPQEDVTSGGGVALSTLSFPQEDDIAGAFMLPRSGATGFVMVATSGGMVKRSEVSLLPGATGQVFTIIGVTESDQAVSVCQTRGDEDIMLFTQQGMAIRFKQDDVRAMGLPATGVVGIRLLDGDIVLSMGVADETNQKLEVVLGTTDGHAKRLAFKDYPVQGRGGKGVVTAKLTRDITVADAVMATEEDAIVYITVKGGAKSLKARNLKRRGRPAGGDEAIAISGSDRLARMMVVGA
ncbi:MAG: DNA topoisomerase (ATP-hydrolyzing) subunit A [Chloroflexi bacterium]|nr:DNA topoisomerase (ATP-hydrolyzing) subunit A [Chloroflexota bacterium]MCL5275456.1 DNA topoisomerase (ATP-hydrolyzing) subunit A [Chloroflexota bacterium]